MEPVIWRDGSLIEYSDATVHVMSHATARGSQVFDVMAVYVTDDGPAVFGLRPHVTRFVRSMGLMGMEKTLSVAEIEEAVGQTVRANCIGPDAPLAEGPWLVKLVAAWDEADGILPASLTPIIFIVVSDFVAPEPGELPDPIRLKVAEMPKIPAAVLPPSLKVAAGYTPALRHMLAARAEGFDHVVFKTMDGDLAESVASSLLVVSDGKLIAPPVDTVLDSITRGAVFECATFLDIPAEIRPVAWREVTGADELFLSSTTKTVLPVGSLDGRELVSPGPVTLKLGGVLSATVAGRHELSARWMTTI